MNVSMDVILGVAVGVSIFSLVILAMAVRSLKGAPKSGAEGLVGREAVVIEDLSPLGLVKCHGEIWKAVSLSGNIVKSETVTVVVRNEGLTLIVRPLEDQEEEMKKEDMKI